MLVLGKELLCSKVLHLARYVVVEDVFRHLDIPGWQRALAISLSEILYLLLRGDTNPRRYEVLVQVEQVAVAALIQSLLVGTLSLRPRFCLVGADGPLRMLLLCLLSHFVTPLSMLLLRTAAIRTTVLGLARVLSLVDKQWGIAVVDVQRAEETTTVEAFRRAGSPGLIQEPLGILHLLKLVHLILYVFPLVD